jgi:hypothetical protein
MTDKSDAFIAEIRNWPEFVAELSLDGPRWTRELEAIERGFEFIAQKADDDPHVIEIHDQILIAIARKDLSIRQRLLEFGRLFIQMRDAGRSVN